MTTIDVTLMVVELYGSNIYISKIDWNWRGGRQDDIRLRLVFANPNYEVHLLSSYVEWHTGGMHSSE